MPQIAVIGAGNMGGALTRGAIAAGIAAGDVTVSDPNADVLAALAADLGIHTAASNRAAVSTASIVLLCVKPQIMTSVLQPLGGRFHPDQIVVSVAAGITIAQLEKLVGPGVPVVRVMPNTPCLIGEGVIGFSRGSATTEAHVRSVRPLLRGVGTVFEVSEDLLDAVTAVSGSGPAWVFAMMEAMIEGAVALGLAPEIAAPMVLGTIRGSALLAERSGVPAAELRRRVTSPGGTTAAGLQQLAQADFNGIVRAALTAARDRGRELGGST